LDPAFFNQKNKNKAEMKPRENNYAYIDGANLHNGVSCSGWQLDYVKFRVWLSEKYSVSKAYIFIGLIPKYSRLYKYLQEAGFILIFKETIYDNKGKPKGNCDADLVLRAVIDAFEGDVDNAVVVSSDGDYASLVSFLKERSKIRVVLSTHPKDKCSILLKRTNVPITYLDDVKSLIRMDGHKEKAPDRDKTL
jgi:uncharacterized LabA/DUF88 family protein